jgi:hypothetical protein
MKWLKKNWIYLVLVALIGYLLINDVVKTESYKREKSILSDSIAIVEYRYSVLEKEADVLSELVSAYKFADSLYQDSLKFSNRQLINQKRSYEKAMADLTRIPTDTLYRELTGWLDSLSFQ